MLLPLAAASIGCTHPELAEVSAYGDTNPILVPENVHTVAGVPGGSVGTKTIRAGTAALLRERLGLFFHTTNLSVEPPIRGNAKLWINPTLPHLDNVAGECALGLDTACLVGRSMFDPGAPPAGWFNAEPFSGDHPPNRLLALVTLFPGEVGDQDPIQPAALNDFRLNLTDDGTAWEALRELLPSYMKMNKDVVVRISVPDQFLGTEEVSDANGNPELVSGLWLDVDLIFENKLDATWLCTCSNPPNTYGSGMPAEICDGICGTGLCGFTDIPYKFNSLKFKLGLIPEAIPGCDPLLTVDKSVSFDEDPRLGWMPNFPGGKAYRQDCLSVRPVLAWGFRREPFLHVLDDAYEVNAYHGPGMAVAVHAGNCNPYAEFGLDLVKGIIDGLFEGLANPAIATVAGDNIGGLVGENLLPWFQYNSRPDGPFQQPETGPGCPLVVFDGGGNIVQNAECTDLTQSDLLPASITRLAYDWFAAPFAPVDAVPTHQYPVWRITPRCPAGSTRMPNGDCMSGIIDGFEIVPPEIDVEYLANPDRDAYVGADDNCPFEYNPSQLDSDFDGVGNACDICPSDSNPEQKELDLDGDGTPDACETKDQCPCDPVNNPDLPQDHDHVCGYCDGRLGGPGSFCESYCKGPVLTQIDNCPAVDNDDQSNWNKEIEGIRNAAEMGDVCDPVPTPRFRPVYEGEELYSHMKFDSDPWVQFIDTESWVELSSIRVAGLGSHRILGGAETWEDQYGYMIHPEERRVDVDTEYRACVDVPFEVDCGLDEQVANKFIVLANNVADETDRSVWHRVSIDEVVPQPGSAADGSDWNPLDVGLEYVSTKGYDRTWNWKDDYQRWSQGWGAGIVPAQPSNPDEGVARFWVHGRTNVGESDDQFGFGLHPIPPDDSGMSPDDHSRLVNAYETVSPVKAVVTERLVRYLKIMPWEFFFGRNCPGCEGGNISPLDCVTCGPLGALPDFRDPFETLVLVIVPAEVGCKVGVLRPDGQLQLVTDKLSEQLQNTLASDAVMVGAVEPTTSIGAGARYPAGVALSPDGTEIRDRVLQRQGGFLSERDLIVDMIDGVDAPLAAMQTMASSQGPAPRTEFQAVYSRAAARLFLVGGADASTNELTGDIWWRDVNGASWFPVPLEGYAPETVTAATYSYRDHNLWVLDQLDSGPIPRARLTRIDPVSGKHTIVGTWPRLRLGHKWVFDKHWLVLDQDGSVLLVASSSMINRSGRSPASWTESMKVQEHGRSSLRPRALNRHVIVRINVDGDTPQVGGVRIAPHALAGPPAVDPAGYSLLLDQKKKLPKLKRLETLEAHPGRWLDLGGCL